ncbi:MAG: hypothetical protein COA78_08650 [Blastopirellula sp.]|nr:MAG: hypothetical protein COA78_08650 [Blastopirellula sp.]
MNQHGIKDLIERCLLRLGGWVVILVVLCPTWGPPGDFYLGYPERFYVVQSDANPTLHVTRFLWDVLVCGIPVYGVISLLLYSKASLRYISGNSTLEIVELKQKLYKLGEQCLLRLAGWVVFLLVFVSNRLGTQWIGNIQIGSPVRFYISGPSGYQGDLFSNSLSIPMSITYFLWDVLIYGIPIYGMISLLLYGIRRCMGISTRRENTALPVKENSANTQEEE